MDPNQITGLVSSLISFIKALVGKAMTLLPNKPFDLAGSFQAASSIFNTFNKWLESAIGVSFTRLLRVIGEFFISIFSFLIELIKRALDFLK